MNKTNNNFTLMIIDNFFENPFEVREYALNQEFNLPGYNIPGIRSNNLNNFYETQIQLLLKPFFKIIKLKKTFFHIMRSFDKQFIHVDTQNIKSNNNCLSGIIFLYPNANINSGTSFYYKKYNTNKKIEIYDKIMDIGNIFNRLILFDCSIYHVPVNCFGDLNDNSRLTLNFFIECENT